MSGRPVGPVTGPVTGPIPVPIVVPNAVPSPGPAPSRGPAGASGRAMTALRFEAPHRIALARVPRPGAPGPDAVTVRTSLVGLCGTDLELLHGTAAYLRDGRAGYPLVPGHEWCGTVVEVGRDVAGFTPGDRVVGHTMVHCGLCRMCRQGRRPLCERLTEVGLYGRQGAAAQYVQLPERSLSRVPDEVPDRTAVLTEPAVTVVAGLEQARCRLGDRVAVIGTGTMGLLAVQLAARLGESVDAVGIDPAGRDLALRCGARRALTPGQARTAGARYALAVEASGAVEAFGLGLELLEPGGRLAVIGVAGQPYPDFAPGRLALRGLEVIGVRHGLDHYDRTLGLFRDGVLVAEPLIAAVLPPAAGPAAFRLLAEGRSGPPKILLDFGRVGGPTPFVPGPAGPGRRSAPTGRPRREPRSGPATTTPPTPTTPPVQGDLA
ncbi:zinc-dependent alcohol dehydrogenase [Streptomyces sp. BE303]|uniref:zinc-dependent alcohol dehydrogenase n=1 Tax=Streptomyces sp. BE303 TaxID=3002528 RepID=UPI002E771C8C|nr:alcohol dehydrogenase catalytic domain-containing protein [Streptomyces sp. BE303]MED7949889.1 alcohol dehydrogenase catalytic domain-containing protein [Streptomyces sp. BE303]